MASGVAVNPACGQLYNEFNTGAKLYRCVSFKINDKCTEIEVDTDTFQFKKVNEDSRQDTIDTLELLCQRLTDGDAKTIACPRWIIFNFDYTSHDGRSTDKTIILMWCPDTAKIKQRMVFSASDRAFKDYLKTSARSPQCDCIADIKEIFDKLEQGKL